jgi:hypothetical protein
MFLKARKLGLKKLFDTVKIERLTPLTFEEKLGWVKKKLCINTINPMAI